MLAKKKLRDNRLMLPLNDDQATFVRAAAEASDLPEASWVRTLIETARQMDPGKVRLSQEEQAIARSAGLTLQQYAAMKLRLEDEKHRDPLRYGHG